jgi:hypothetical protein
MVFYDTERPLTELADVRTRLHAAAGNVFLQAPRPHISDPAWCRALIAELLNYTLERTATALNIGVPCKRGDRKFLPAAEDQESERALIERGFRFLRAPASHARS